MGPMECQRGLVVRRGSFRPQQRVGFKPECAGSRKWVCSSVLPPQSFIAAAMDLTVVRAAERHRKLVAHFAPERTRLREP
jgi:hypothetical protein